MIGKFWAALCLCESVCIGDVRMQHSTYNGIILDKNENFAMLLCGGVFCLYRSHMSSIFFGNEKDEEGMTMMDVSPGVCAYKYCSYKY